MLRITRLMASLGLVLLLAGCEILPDFLGAGESEAPLPGRRIAILALDKGLTPNPSIADLRVRLPQPYSNQAWTHFGGSASHALYHLSLAEAPRVAWRRDVGDNANENEEILAQPLVVGDFVFTMDSRSIVSAFEMASGRLLWRVDLEPEDEDAGFFGGGLAYDGERLFVTTGFAQVFALNPRNGGLFWVKDVPAPVRAAPAADGGRVFVVTLDNQTITLAADDGRRLWSHSGVQETTGLIGSASPAVAGKIVVSPYSSGEIIGLSVEDGRVLWDDNLSTANRVDPLADLAHIRGTPVIDRGIVFVISHAGRMVALDLEQGLRAWQANIGGIEMPWVGGDFIFVLTNDAQVVCLTRRDGRIRWVQPLPRFSDPEDQEGLIQWRGPVLAGNRLIVAGSHGDALSISPYTGEVLGLIELPDGIAIAPTVARDNLFFLTTEAELVTLR